MATVLNNVADTVYELITAADALLQNNSAYHVRVAFAASLPDVDEVAYHLLEPGEAILKSGGLPTGNIYARCDRAGSTSNVVYSV